MSQDYIFLDDERHPRNVTWVDLPAANWVVVRSYDEFVKTVTARGLPAFVTFDHDLADEHYRASMTNPDRHYNNYYTDGTFKEKTGYDAAKWLVDYCLEHEVSLPQWQVHTLNPIGRENIIGYLTNAEKVCGTHPA